MADLPIEIDVEDAAALRTAGSGARWIDCREADEWQICHIEGARLLPLSTFPEEVARHLTDLDQHLIVYCHHGVRSLRATQWLRARGFHQAQSLRGGIDRWTDLIDPTLARY